MILRRTSLVILCVLVSLAGVAVAEEATPIAPGTTYTSLYRPEGPWAIHVVTVDTTEKLVRLGALLARGDETGREQVTRMLAAARTQDRRPVAAVNGDFFAPAGQGYTTLPLGFHVQDGELVTLPDPGRSVFYLLSDGSPHIGRFRANCWLLGPGGLMFPLSGVNRPPEPGELTLLTPRFGRSTRSGESALQVTLTELSGPPRPNAEVTGCVAQVAVGPSQTIPNDGAVLVASGVAAYALRNLKPGDPVTLRFVIEARDGPQGEIQEAIGGGPRLVRNGAVAVEYRAERFSESFASQRHPRTGVGVRDRQVVLVAVDGRQPGYSHGMTLREFAQLFVELGCQEAMNLDGGGSTTMVVRDRVVNCPSDGAPRRVANALAVWTTAPVTGKPVRLAIEPAEANVLAGEKLALNAVGLDEYFNQVPLAPQEVEWQCSASLGTVDRDGVFCASSVEWPLAGLVVARCGALTASTVIRVVPAPARLAIVPARVNLRPGAAQRFVVRAYDDRNEPVAVPPGRYTWEVSPMEAGARIDANGVLKAPTRPSRLTVTARLGELTAQAQVLVGAVTTVLVDFEGPVSFASAGAPEGVAAEAALVQDPLNRNNRCLRLKYDLSAGTGTRVARVDLETPLGATSTMSLRVMADGQGGWLRARVRDAAGRAFTIDLADRLNWSGEWRTVTGWLPEEATPPVSLESIYVTEFRPDRRPAGEVFLDDLGVSALSSEGGP